MTTQARPLPVGPMPIRGLRPYQSRRETVARPSIEEIVRPGPADVLVLDRDKSGKGRNLVDMKAPPEMAELRSLCLDRVRMPKADDIVPRLRFWPGFMSLLRKRG